MVSHANIMQDVQYLLENNLTDPYKGTRVGSMVMSSDRQLNFNKYMPKLQVSDGDVSTEDLSFGNTNRKRNNTHVVNVYFITKRGESGSGTTFKDRALVHHYLDLIETSIFDNVGSVGSASLIGFGNVDSIPYDPEHGIFIGMKPVVFKLRRKS